MRSLIELDRGLEALLGRHPDAALILSLPGANAARFAGMGVVPAKSRGGLRDTAELVAEAGNLSRFRSADALASAAGLAPVPRRSGRTRFLRRPNGGDKGLRRVFCQSAPCSLGHDDSRAFHDRKRRGGSATTRPSPPSHDAA